MYFGYHMAGMEPMGRGGGGYANGSVGDAPVPALMMIRRASSAAICVSTSVVSPGVAAVAAGAAAVCGATSASRSALMSPCSSRNVSWLALKASLEKPASCFSLERHLMMVERASPFMLRVLPGATRARSRARAATRSASSSAPCSYSAATAAECSAAAFTPSAARTRSPSSATAPQVCQTAKWVRPLAHSAASWATSPTGRSTSWRRGSGAT